MRGEKSIFFLVKIGLLTAIAIGIIFGATSHKQTIEWKNDTLWLNFCRRNAQICIWENENGTFHFFLPSFANNNTFFWEDDEFELVVNQATVEKKFTFDTNSTYEVSIISIFSQEPIWEGNVAFHKSNNIPTIMLDMDEANYQILQNEKGQKVSATIRTITKSGNIDYEQDLSWIKLRGNTTRECEKKSYGLKLQQKERFLNIGNAREWVLLANYFDDTKMKNELTLNLASASGIPYVPKTKWADLYINGVYQGNYLVTEKVGAEFDSKNTLPFNASTETGIPYVEGWTKGYDYQYKDINLDVTYLLEKDLPAYYVSEDCGLITPRLNTFTLKTPQLASREQMEFLQDIVQKIDLLMEARDESVWYYLDAASLSQKYILDEMSMNPDANVTSAFFYKKQGDNILFAGPPWDYDMAYRNTGDMQELAKGTILNIREMRGENDSLDWYNALAEMQSGRDTIRKEYEKMRPYYVLLVEEKIDTKKEYIKDSVLMDQIRWEKEETDFDEQVDLLKSFLMQRIQMMDNWYS